MEFKGSVPTIVVVAHGVSWSTAQFVEQRLGVPQICGVEALGESVLDVGKHRAGFGLSVVLLP